MRKLFGFQVWFFGVTTMVISLFVIVVAYATSQYSVSVADTKFIGENASDQSGWSVSSSGDFDGDGRDDILIGALGNDAGGSNAGAAYFFLGSSTYASSIDTSAARIKFIGEESYDVAGHKVTFIGDINGDQKEDIAISAPNYDADGTNKGVVYIVLGSSTPMTGNFDLSQARKIIGRSNYDYFGNSLSYAGDVNADGYDDFLVGAPYEDVDGVSNRGVAYLIWGHPTIFSGTTSSTATLSSSTQMIGFLGKKADDLAGSQVGSAGDIDNDGKGDILIAAPQNDDSFGNAGTVYLIYGNSSLSATEKLNDYIKFTGETVNDQLGSSLSYIGGSSTQFSYNGPSTNTFSHIAFSSITKSISGMANAGKVYVFFGSSTRYTGSRNANTANVMFTGSAANVYLGTSLQTPSTTRTNEQYTRGVLLIGADGTNVTSTNSVGAVYVVKNIYSMSGTNGIESGNENIVTRYHGEAFKDFLGVSVSAGNIFNDDNGNFELLIGADGEETGGGDAGAAYLLDFSE